MRAALSRSQFQLPTILTRLLRQHHGRIGEVARAAGIAERNLYEKMKTYGLSRDDYR